jgi:hypothetical protein
MKEEAVLQSIDSKLSALLALTIDQYLREIGAKRKTRSIDRLLSDAGLTSTQIGPLLGKTGRAVNLVLAGERNSSKEA